MISDEQITSAAMKLQTSELNIIREYFQHIFLHNLYQQEKSDHVLFKGGTALKLAFNSPRFSEDLDFDYCSNTHEVMYQKIRIIETMILNTIAETEKSNININISEAKTTSGGYLAIIQFNAQHNPVNIQIEVSFRKNQKLQSETVLITSHIYPAYTVNILSQDQIIEGKIHALMERRKPRDYFDLYFILRSGLLHPKQKSILKNIINTISVQKDFFTKELLEFLPRSHHALIRSFRTELIKEITRYS